GNVVHKVTTIGILAAFIQDSQRFIRPIPDFREKCDILQSAMASSERMFKLLETPVEITSPAVTKGAEGPGRIEFDHVWFAYRSSSHATNGGRASSPGVATNILLTGGDARPPQASQPDWVLRNVSFAIEPGETVAIVGHTG